MVRVQTLLGAALLVQLTRQTSGFQVWWDGGFSFGTFHYPNTTEQCSRQCPAGFGCVVQTDGATTCGKCDAEAVSGSNETWCRSCKYADASSWGMWSNIVKVSLSASKDQSRCEVADKQSFWWITVRNVLTIFGGCAGGGLLWALYLICVADHLLHRLIRQKKWAKALELLASKKKRRVLCSHEQSVAQLVNRRGRSGRTPLQLALELGMNSGHARGSSMKAADYGTLGDGFGDGSSAGVGAGVVGECVGEGGAFDTMRVPLVQRLTSISRTHDDTHHDENMQIWRSPSPWRKLVKAMLNMELEQKGNDGDTQIRSTCTCCSTTMAECANTVLFAMFFLIAAIWIFVYEGSRVGALIDQGDFGGIFSNAPPKTLQECDHWCTVLTCFYFAIALLLYLPLYRVIGVYTRWISILFELTKRTADATAASALLGIVLTFNLSCYGTIIEGAFLDYGGMGWLAMCAMLGTVLGANIGPWLIERYVMRESDPYAGSLKHLLDQKSHTVSTIWPLVRRCVVSQGPKVWQILIPVNIDASARTLAVDVVSALAEIAAMESNTARLEENARVLHTLIEAHIAGIVDNEACAACVERVTKMDHKALSDANKKKEERDRIYQQARLFLGDQKSTPAEMALLATPAVGSGSEVKRAALFVIYDRFAFASIEERIYESATCRVYRAEDLVTGTIVAIKLFADRIHYAKEIAMRDSLQSCTGIEEFVVADCGRYDHTHAQFDCTRTRADWKQEIITTLFGNFGRLDEIKKGFGSGAIVMPLADYDLNSRLSLTRIAGIDAKECAAIIRPIIAALAEMHRHGVVHADVKPRNIVFVKGAWKLIDLDAAHAIGDGIDTSKKDFKWTSGFASPELARCRCAEPKGTLVADPKMDVFSLGILAFELLTGQPLFPQDTCNNSMVDPECVPITFMILHLGLSAPTNHES